MRRQLRLGERGVSISVFTVISLMALMIAGGLAADGAAAARAHRKAEAAAAQVARLAADAGAAARLAGSSEVTVAVAAANNAASNYDGITFNVQVVGTQIVVETTTGVSTTFLQLIGISSLDVSGRAAAELIPESPR